jgi:hypothetical protein
LITWELKMSFTPFDINVSSLFARRNLPFETQFKDMYNMTSPSALAGNDTGALAFWGKGYIQITFLEVPCPLRFTLRVGGTTTFETAVTFATTPASGQVKKGISPTNDPITGDYISVLDTHDITGTVLPVIANVVINAASPNAGWILKNIHVEPRP